MPVIHIKGFVVISRTKEEAEDFERELKELCMKYAGSADNYYYKFEVEDE